MIQQSILQDSCSTRRERLYRNTNLKVAIQSHTRNCTTEDNLLQYSFKAKDTIQSYNTMALGCDTTTHKTILTLEGLTWQCSCTVETWHRPAIRYLFMEIFFSQFSIEFKWYFFTLITSFSK